MINIEYLKRFIKESNAIESIFEYDEDAQVDVYSSFLDLDEITITDLTNFVKQIQPNAPLRAIHGMDVQVGRHLPIHGGPHVVNRLTSLLEKVNVWNSNIWSCHIAYEILHPFMDGNGRSGRAIWLWQVARESTITEHSILFLQAWYYRSLQEAR